MKKRILSIALALMMVFALLPFGAMAVDRPVTAPYKSILKSILGQSSGNADGLFVDLNGDDVPELLVAYEFYDGSRGTAFYTIENGRAKWLLNADNLHDDLSFYSNDYASLDVVVRSGRPYVMASRTSFFEGEWDAQYGQTYWDSGEFWLYEFANASLTQVDHWSYQFHELEDGRYFAEDLSLRHNGVPASVESLDAFWDSITILLTVSLYDDTNGIPVDALLRATEGKFIDVEPEEYYALPVDWAVAKGITNGTGAYTFSPMEPCTRGQVVTFLWRAAGSPEPKSANHPFTDIKPSDYFYKAVLWAVEQGITNGMDLTHFGPEVPCTRAHVVTFLWRANGKPAAGSRNPFVDVPAGEYYTDAVLWAVSKNITNGMDETHFGPDSTCIRGQIVTFLYRAMADPDEPIPTKGSELSMAISTDSANYMNESFGQGLANYVNDNTDTTVTVTSVGDSEANLQALLNGDVQMCFCRADVAYDAFHGLGRYAEAGENHDFSVVAALFSSAVVPFSIDKADESVADFRGKTVSVGPEGSYLCRSAMDILAAYGMTLEDIHPVYLSLEETAAAIHDGEVEAAFIRSGAEWSNLMQKYTLNHIYNDLPLDAEHMEALLASAPYFALMDEYNTSRPEIPVLLLTRNDVSDDDVFNVVSTITDSYVVSLWDYPQLTANGFAAAARGVPYHPVAAEWFGI